MRVLEDTIEHRAVVTRCIAFLDPGGIGLQTSLIIYIS